MSENTSTADLPLTPALTPALSPGYRGEGAIQITHAMIGRILTRSSGFLTTVASHSLQPYRGCALGNSLCGVGCYVRHSWYVTRGAPWGSFVEARTNAADAYRAEYDAERAWARRARGGRFGVFL